jgi:hypothetical protein
VAKVFVNIRGDSRKPPKSRRVFFKKKNPTGKKQLIENS